MMCTDPRELLLSYQSLGIFILILFLLTLATQKISIQWLKKLCYVFIFLAAGVYSLLLTPWGAHFSIKLNTVSLESPFSSKNPIGTVLNSSQFELIQKKLPSGWQQTFVYFGYTFCPDICPTTLGLLKDLYQKKNIKILDSTPVLFISLDPERDTEDRLKEYLSYFFSNIYFLRPDQNELERLAREFGVLYKNHKKGQDQYYSVDHSAFVYVLNSKGKITNRFDHPLDLKIVEDQLNNEEVQ